MKKGGNHIIKQIRLEKKISQRYMASQLLISQSYYSRIEQGKTELTLNSIVAISRIFNIEPIALFQELILADNPPHS